LTSYRPRLEDSEDLQCLGLLKAIELYRKDQEAALKALAPFQPIPPVLWDLVPDLKQTERWSSLRTRLLYEEVLPALEIFLPLLQGKAEQLPKSVYQALRDHWGKWKAQKRAGAEDSLSLDDVLAKAEGVSDQQLAANVESNLVVEKVAKMAEDRWGDQGRRFVEALIETGNMAEACREASISRPTGYKYREELKNLLKKF
jgi:hypothetical protein